MKERTIFILQALVEDFIATANPVASKRLLETRNLEISSATIRNEFAILEEVGLVESPHISAGKIPTKKGYRFFVDEVLPQQEQEMEKIVEQVFNRHIAEYRIQKQKESLFDALRLVAQLSGNVAFANIENDRTFYLGISNVLRSPEFVLDPEKAAQIVEILEGKHRFSELLKKLPIEEKTIKIFIGEENILEEISSCAIIAVRFKNSDICGIMGILGPMRMQYGYNKALLQNVLGLLD